MRHNGTKHTSSFLVCGLGNLGQYCISVLKEYGVRVNAIELVDKKNWEIPDIADLLDKLVIGDCRQGKILEQAGIRDCRAILLVTSNEQVNIAAAFAARALNPNIRLVVRSAQDNLNELLSHSLGNFVAFEATQLPAKSFALAAFGSETRGFFTLDNQLLRVVRVEMDDSHHWCNNRQMWEINNSHRRILLHARASKPLPKGFYHWEAEARVQRGDTIAYVEVTPNSLAPASRRRTTFLRVWRKLPNGIKRGNLQQRFRQFWQQGSQTQRVAAMSGIVMLCLFGLGMVLYKLQYPDVTWHDAFNVSLVLSLGGFDNLFGQRKLPFSINWLLYFFSISVTVAGTVFVGILYALLTERIVAARFEFSPRRSPVPKSDHVVLIGLGRVGQRVAKQLQQLNQPVVGVNSSKLDSIVLPQMPLIVGDIKNALTKVNIATARSIVALTDDEVANLEIALMAHAANPKAHLVIRTFDPLFSENIAQMLPYARVLGAYSLAAEAFAAAAFGENIISLFRLNDQTTLVVEYDVKLSDTLNGKLLAEIAYGYGVVPILHAKSIHEPAKLMPSDDIRLEVGDRLVVLATIEGLQHIEHGNIKSRQWFVRVEKATSEEAVFTAAGIMARVSGCDINVATTLMKQLPGTLPHALYKHQAQRLVIELRKAQVVAHI